MLILAFHAWLHIGSSVAAAGLALTAALAGLRLRRLNRRVRALNLEHAARVLKLEQVLARVEKIAHIGHWWVNLADRNISWSDEVYEIFDLPRHKRNPAVEDIIACYHPEDRAGVRSSMRRAIETAKSFDFDARLLRGDGEVRYVRCRGMAECRDAGTATAMFGVAFDQTEQKRAEARLQRATEQAEAANRALQRLALEDWLTGLANRRRFDLVLEEELRRARRSGGALALIMLDVDHFKQYNDIYGHPAGDECLRAIAAELRKCSPRAGDMAARLGGEEFAILIPAADEAAAESIAERIVAAIRNLSLSHAGNGPGVVTISAGVAALAPVTDRSTARLLFQAADSALYLAKRLGRDRACCDRAVAGTVP